MSRRFNLPSKVLFADHLGEQAGGEAVGRNHHMTGQFSITHVRQHHQLIANNVSCFRLGLDILGREAPGAWKTPGPEQHQAPSPGGTSVIHAGTPLPSAYRLLLTAEV
jgi:TPP-dependent pyruvate/acetoin dehydrogenase alpha subunit